jgi:hypothetical protein
MFSDVSLDPLSEDYTCANHGRTVESSTARPQTAIMMPKISERFFGEIETDIPRRLGGGYSGIGGRA